MAAVSLAAVLPLLVLLLLFATDLSVYVDATAQAKRGRPIVFSYGAFKLDRPAEWFVGCFFLWIVFFPLYIVGRSR
jgi:hypothetical protein